MPGENVGFEACMEDIASLQSEGMVIAEVTITGIDPDSWRLFSNTWLP
jgi:hypothetical protein